MAMDAILKAIYEATFDAQIALHGDEVKIADTTYPCDAGAFAKQDKLEIGGFMGEPTVKIFVKQSLFSQAPQIGDSALYRELPMKISKIESTNDDTVYAIELMNIHK
jgi:hypothetical protein